MLETPPSESIFLSPWMQYKSCIANHNKKCSTAGKLANILSCFVVLLIRTIGCVVCVVIFFSLAEAALFFRTVCPLSHRHCIVYCALAFSSPRFCQVKSCCREEQQDLGFCKDGKTASFYALIWHRWLSLCFVSTFW